MQRFFILGTVWMIFGCGGREQESLDGQLLLLQMQLPGVFAVGGRRAKELDTRYGYVQIWLKSKAGWEHRAETPWPKDRRIQIPEVDFPRSANDQLTIRLSLWFAGLKHPTLAGKKLLSYEEFSRGKSTHHIIVMKADSKTPN